MKLFARSLNSKKESIVTGVTRDGWVVTEDGAFGDHGEDCELSVVFDLKEWRTKNHLTQQEVAWMFNVSRPTYTAMEANKQRGLTLVEYLIIQNYLPDDTFYAEKLTPLISKLK